MFVARVSGRPAGAPPKPDQGADRCPRSSAPCSRPIAVDTSTPAPIRTPTPGVRDEHLHRRLADARWLDHGNLDPAHTVASFSVRHLMSRVRGTFTDVSGQIVTGSGPNGSTATAESATASVPFTRPAHPASSRHDGGGW
ncbi:YceI family protein [Spirillospora sp. NPDC048911]|uniref:YceI family protein n=1 Tax=Spirillospora sp. NPDC048911 TaxID=3364527 RepID=UPI0037129EFE